MSTGAGETDGLDRWLRAYDVGHCYEHPARGEPADNLRVLLATPIGCDNLTRALFAARGLHSVRTPLGDALESLGFDVLERSATALVVGSAGRPWRVGERPRPFADDRPGQVRIAVDFRARPGFLSTETRVLALDEGARRAFRRYWLVVGPFSGLIRRRWLVAASRAIAAANRSVASPSGANER
jgi:hypothetical protein